MLKSTNKIIFFLLLIWSNDTSAQQSGMITGQVKDARTQQLLIGANVVVPGTQRGASTDTTGRFVIRRLAPGSYRLRISYIGYEPLIKTDIVVTTGAPALVNASLVPAAVLGESITVSAGYFVDTELAPVSKTTLSREEIRRFPGGFEDVVRTAATLPGVAVVNEGGRNDLLVRGGGRDGRGRHCRLPGWRTDPEFSGRGWPSPPASTRCSYRLCCWQLWLG